MQATDPPPERVDPAPEPVEAPDASQEPQGLRFDDPYWDDMFCAWLDPTMRTCCG